MNADTGPNKAIASVAAGAVAVIATYFLNRYMPPPPLPDFVGGAIQTLITTLAVYFVPHGGE